MPDIIISWSQSAGSVTGRNRSSWIQNAAGNRSRLPVYWTQSAGGATGGAIGTEASAWRQKATGTKNLLVYWTQSAGADTVGATGREAAAWRQKATGTKNLLSVWGSPLSYSIRKDSIAWTQRKAGAKGFSSAYWSAALSHSIRTDRYAWSQKGSVPDRFLSARWAAARCFSIRSEGHAWTQKTGAEISEIRYSWALAHGYSVSGGGFAWTQRIGAETPDKYTRLLDSLWLQNRITETWEGLLYFAWKLNESVFSFVTQPPLTYGESEFLDAVRNPQVKLNTLAVFRYFDFDSGAEKTECVSTGGFVSEPTDTQVPASTAFDDIIVNSPAEYGASLDMPNPGENRMSVRAANSDGDIEIYNAGERDGWLLRPVEGRTVEIFLGAKSGAAEKWTGDDYRLVNTLTAICFNAAEESITLRVRGKEFLLDKPAQTNLFSMDAAKDKPLPLPFGRLNRAAPVYIGIGASGRDRYKISEKPIQAISDIQDDGVSLGSGFTAFLSAGEFETHATPAGSLAVNFDGIVSGGAWLEKTAEIVKYLATNQGGLTEDDLDAESFALHLLACPQRVGLFIAERMNLNEAIDELLDTTWSYRYWSRDGKMKIRRFKGIAEPPVLYLTADDIELRGLSQSGDLIPPITSARIGYAENLSPTEQYGGAAESARAALAAQYLVASTGRVLDGLTCTTVTWQSGTTVRFSFSGPPDLSAALAGDYLVCALGFQKDGNIGRHEITAKGAGYVDADIPGSSSVSNDETALTAACEIVRKKTIPGYPNAAEPDTAPSRFTEESDARAEAERRLELFDGPRAVFSVKAFAEPFTTELGDVIHIVYPRFGFENGRLALVTGIRENPSRRRIEFDVWTDSESFFDAVYRSSLATAQGVLIEPERSNFFLNSSAPASQTISLDTGVFTLSVSGPGSAAISANTATGSGWGAATEGNPVTVNISSAGTADCAVSGGPDHVQLENGAFPTSAIVTSGSPATRGGDALSEVFGYGDGFLQEFTLVCVITPSADGGKYADGEFRFFSTDDSGGDRIVFAGGADYGFSMNGGGFVLTVKKTDFSGGTMYKIAVSVSQNGANAECRMAVNGVLKLDAMASGTLDHSDDRKLNIGHYDADSFCGEFKNLILLPGGLRAEAVKRWSSL